MSVRLLRQRVWRDLPRSGRGLTYALVVFVLTRLLVVAAAYIGQVAFAYESGPRGFAIADDLWLNVWSRVDSAYYLRIAEQGYGVAADAQNPVAYFPLYPLLINLLTPLTGNPLLAGVVISHLAFLLALVMLHRLMRLELDDAASQRGLLYIAIAPVAFFFSAVYTESLFLFVSVAAVYAVRQRQWGWATVFGILASATRFVGVLLVAFALFEWLRAHDIRLTSFTKRSGWVRLAHAVRSDVGTLLLIALMPLGLVSYMVYLHVQFGDALAFWTAQPAFGRVAVGPVAVITNALSSLSVGPGSSGLRLLLDLSALVAGVGVTLAIARRLGMSYAVYSGLSLLVPLFSGLGSMSRYLLVVFPVFMMLGSWGRHPLVDRSLLILFAVFLGLLTAAFANWIFVA